MAVKTIRKHLLGFLPSGCRALLRDLYYDEAARCKVRRVASSIFPWDFRKECPFCHSRFHRFEDGGISEPILTETHCIGGGYRHNVTCPRCNSTDRERLLYLFLRTSTPMFSQRLKVLHVAPEPRLQRILSAQSSLEYITADLFSALVMIRVDLVKTGIRSNVFDVIICNHVLEHISDDGKAMGELLRILKPDGWAILQVPLSLSLPDTLEDPTVTDPKERRRRYGQEDHVRIYAAHDYRLRLERSGFLVCTWSALREHGASFLHRYGLIRDENLYVCGKPLSQEAEACKTSSFSILAREGRYESLGKAASAVSGLV